MNQEHNKAEKSNFKRINVLGLFSGAISLTFIIAAVILYCHYEKKAGERLILEDGTALCHLITDAARQEYFGESSKINHNLIDYVVREKRLMYCLISDSNLTPFLQLGSDQPLNDTKIIQNAWNSEYLLIQKYTMKDKNNKEIYEFSKPIYHNGEKVGLVRIGLYLSNYIHLNRSTGYILTLITLAFFILVFIFYHLIKRLLAPIFQMKQELTKMIVEEHEFSELEISFAGEIGQLANKMNQFLQVQQERIKDLEMANCELDVANKIFIYEKSRIRVVLDNLKIGLVLIDSTGKVIMFNKRANHFLKMDLQEYIDKPWEEVLEDQDPALVNLFNEFCQKGSIYGHDSVEIESPHIDAATVLCHDCFYLLDERDKSLGVLWTISDITSLKQAELSRHEFVNHVAHELKTPLNTLRSYSEMLLDNEVENEESKKEFFNSINEEAIRLSRLINNLLNITKIEIPNPKVSKTLIKMDKLLMDCYKAVQPQALNKQIHFLYDIPDKIPNMLLDKDLIEVAILNLLTNAIKYTPNNGKVMLKVLLEENSVLIRVTDNGMGIADSEIDYIFDKFFRSSRDEIRTESGTGLGLSLAMSIVKLHNGDIKAESKVGKGSSFTMTLPIEEVYI
ncbi:MAG: ATP-binding protein [bacterium]